MDILKGSVISDDSIVAYRSLITGQKFDQENVIIGGAPAKVIKNSVGWEI